MRGFEFVGSELLVVLRINEPATCGFDMLARHDRGRRDDYRGEFEATLDLQPQDGKAVLRVVVGHAFDESIQSFGHGATESIRWWTCLS